MTLLDELKIFVKNILHWIYALIVCSIFFFSFGLEETTVFGQKYLLPLPTSESFSVQIFNTIRYDLLPPSVQLLVTNPMSAFVSQILFSVSLAFLSTVPFLVYRIIVYIRPALLPQEKKAVLWSLLPMISLFFS